MAFSPRTIGRMAPVIEPYDPTPVSREFDLGWGSNSGYHSPEIPGVNPIQDIGDDILHLIFEYFNFQPGSPTAAQNRKDLLSAAQTCKALAEPALNVLWRVLPSLLPLLLLFPSAEIVNNHYFVDNLPLTKWEPFETHARRVRTLYMEPIHVVVSPTTYILIRDMYGSPILPGLKAIYIPDDESIDLLSVTLLPLGASLDIVELNNSAISERSFFNPFLTLLASKSPQLRHLALRGQGNISLDPLYHFTKIQRLEMKLLGTYMYPQTLRSLGNLVDLQDLTLDVGAFTPIQAIDTQPDHSPSSSSNFGKLRRLHIIGIPNSITRVLDDIILTNLTALVIDERSHTSNTNAYTTRSFWERCFHQVSACLAIEDIEINQLDHRSWGHDYYPLSTSWLRPLTNLHNVRSLVVNGSALSGPDEDFHLMAIGFPKLEKLVVPPEYCSKGRTLACLSYFSQYCPELCEIKICIAFDIARNLRAITNLPRTTDSHNPLKKLYINSQFGEIQTIQMIQVAQFLDLLFPKLSTLETYGSSDETEALTWTGIQQTRLALQATRIKTLRRVTSKMATDNTSSDVDDYSEFTTFGPRPKRNRSPAAEPKATTVWHAD